ncbi:MAG: hypothetical protein ACE5FV_04445 [Woeseia sp.]
MSNFWIVIIGSSILANRVSDMKNRFLVVFLAAMLPGLAAAQGADKYQCKYGDLQRRVEIFHETGVTVPCEVQYFKDTEAPGERQVLWRAMNEEGYCERKAQEFIAQLTEWGWNCGPSDVSEPASEPEPVSEPEPAEPAEADDTGSLEPAEEAEPTEN